MFHVTLSIDPQGLALLFLDPVVDLRTYAVKGVTTYHG